MTVYKTDDLTDDSVFTYTEDDFDSCYAILSISLSYGPNRQVQTSNYRMTWTAAIEGATETRINEELIAVFGYLPVGVKLFARLYKQSAGAIRSTPLTTTTIVLQET
jgi:hypothetical protein